MLRRAPTFTEEVPYQDDRRGPHRPAEDAVEEERAPAHAAHAGYQRFEQAGDREETGREDGLATVEREESFDLLQALRGELHILPPLQDERSSPFVANPVTDLVPDDGPEDTKHYGLREVKVALLSQYTGGHEYGRARERDTGGPEHHAEEDDQVPVVLDQGVEFFHGGRSIKTAATPMELSERGAGAPSRTARRCCYGRRLLPDRGGEMGRTSKPHAGHRYTPSGRRRISGCPHSQACAPIASGRALISRRVLRNTPPRWPQWGHRTESRPLGCISCASHEGQMKR